MSDGLLVVLLEDERRSSAELEATLASVRAEAGADVAIAVAGDTDTPGRLAEASLVALIRAGDRWRQGTLAPRVRVLRAHPTAAFLAAGHARVDEDGVERLVVRAPKPPLSSTDVLLHRAVEASAVIVRASVLDAAGLRLLGRPYGDTVLWSRLLRGHAMLDSGEIAADVRIDPDRHGLGVEPRSEELLLTASEVGDEPGASTVRRELLRRLYLESAGITAGTDLVTLFPDGAAQDARVRDVVADLQWALERQVDALTTERITWATEPPGYGVEHPEAGYPDEELMDLRSTVIRFGGEIAIRDSKIRRLEAEVYRRDAIIERLQGGAGHDGEQTG
jgi:hypothetical protein